MSKFAEYSFQQLQQQGPYEAIYALNTSNLNEKGRRERILISVPKMGNQGLDMLSIPVSHLPINLMDQVPRESVLGSAEFRRAVSRGILTLVSPEEGDKFYTNPKNRKELVTLNSLENTNLSDAQQGVIAGTGDENVATKPVNENATSMRDTGINETVYAAMMTADAGDEDRVILSIKSVEDKSVKDYEFILEKAKDLGFKELERMVSKKLAKLRSDDDDEV